MMKRVIAGLIMLTVAGCRGTMPLNDATVPPSEVVIAEGSAPIVNKNVSAAKKVALDDALKNALGMVVGVYVSQEALTAHAAVIQDSIILKSQGYIERYAIVTDYREGDQYHVTVKAQVRREDLTAKIKTLDLEPKVLGNPTVGIAVRESIDGAVSNTAASVNELRKAFVDAGFVVLENEKPDILVEGNARSSFNTDQGLGGMVSYRTSINLIVYKTGTNDVVTTVEKTVGGVDANRDAAALVALANAGRSAVKDLPQAVSTYLSNHSTVRISITGIGSMNQLNELVIGMRSFPGVRDSRVREFAGDSARIDVDIRSAASAEIAKEMEQMKQFKVVVTKTEAYAITAEVRKEKQ